MSTRTPAGDDPLQTGPEIETAVTGSLLAQMRGGGGDPGVDPEPEVGARRQRPVRVQTVVVALVVAASAGALYMMRRQGMAAGVNFEKTPVIEYALDQPPPRATAEHKRILADLARSGTPTQVPAEALPKNPFQLDVETTEGAAAPTGEERWLAEQERLREAKRAELRAAVATLQLHSVMNGRTPVAIVSGQTVRVGDVIAEKFTVAMISGRSIDLQAEDLLFTLTVGESEVQEQQTLRGPQDAP